MFWQWQMIIDRLQAVLTFDSGSLILTEIIGLCNPDKNYQFSKINELNERYRGSRAT